jgi:hypothetical protein
MPHRTKHEFLADVAGSRRQNDRARLVTSGAGRGSCVELGVLMAWIVLGVHPAMAAVCVIAGPPATMERDNVEWTMSIASGQSCVRGLRLGTMTLDEVSIDSPAKSGEVTVQGYSFTYKAKDGFKGEDSFSVKISGANRRVRGATTISVRVTVR